MAISSPGIGSNLDINSIVTQLMAVEQRPLQVLAQKEAGFAAKLSAFGSIKSALASFQTSMAGLASGDKFSSYKTTVGDSKLIGVQSSAKAVAGSYSVEVQNLAVAQKLKSGTFATTGTSVGTGTITIDFGSYNAGVFTINDDKPTQTIEIDAGDDSLTSVRDAINAAEAGVTASIVNDGTGNRLVIGSKDAGSTNELRITVSDDDGNSIDASGLSKLVYDASAGGTQNMSETVPAEDAIVVIDGMTITSSSNTVEQAIDGVTLNLLKEAVGEPTTVTIARDTSGAKTAVEGFVKSYNELSKVLSDASAYNATTKQAAILQGDNTVRTMQSKMRSLLNSALEASGGGLTRMSDIGVSFQVDGTLKLDSAKLTAALNNPNKDVGTLFASIGKPSDSFVSFVSASADATRGSHAVNVTQLATRGAAVGGQAANLTIAAGVNDSLVVKVDGVSATITLAAGTYTAAGLASAVQAKLNGSAALSDDDIGVTVSESAGVLTLTSNRYGSASKVDVVGGSAASDLFGTPTETDGLDIAGTIGNRSAAGSGRRLTGLGITLEVTGGATGNRGTVAYARGFAAQLSDMALDLLGEDGLIDGRTEGLDQSIKELGTRRESLILRLQTVEKRYRAQFTALDTMMASMLRTSDYLKQQLANLPKTSE